MSETIKYSFRTAMGGFHKGDVVNYISQSAAIHQKKVSDLETQILSLREENAALREQLYTLESEAIEASVPEVPAAEEETLESRELAAYRRAEAAERLAHERAGKLYKQMQTLCQDTAGHMLQVDAVASHNLDAMERQFAAIGEAMEALRNQLSQAKETLEAMSMTLPDPAEGLEEF